MEILKKKFEVFFKLHEELYKEGLIGVSSSSIQIDNSTFAKLAFGLPLRANWIGEYFQVSAEINEVTYITLVK